MLKRLAYIVLLLIFAQSLSSAKIRTAHRDLVKSHDVPLIILLQVPKDTTNSKKHQQEEKIKEISKAKRQSKPEKIGETDNIPGQKDKPKPKRQRRPEGLERPPEIPRRNGS